MQHGNAVAEFGGANNRRSAPLLWKLCCEPELVVDPVPSEYHAAFVATLLLRQPAALLNAQAEESTEVRVQSGAFQFVPRLLLSFSVAANGGLIPGPAASVARTELLPLCINCSLGFGHGGPQLSWDGLRH